MASLNINNASKTYGKTAVLHDVDIKVGEGEFLVLVGPSGCGKSTLLNMIAGLESVTGGTIEIDDAVVNDLPPADRDIAMVFQSYALYPNMTVAKNIAFGLEMRKVPKAERQKAVARVAELLQIEPLLNRKPAQLSGGQRQRVAMGRALVRDPKIFLFDEPLSNLDAKLRVEMRTEIKKLHQRLGTTIVYVTHDQIEAMTMATRIAVMQGGYLQQLGTPKSIYDRPANTFVATFMGSPPMNLIPATVSKSEAAVSLSVPYGNGKQSDISVPADVQTEHLVHGQEVLLGLRPEWFELVDSQSVQADDVTGTWRFLHQVTITEPTGPDLLCMLNFAERTEVVVRLDADAGVEAGDTIELSALLDKAMLFDKLSGEALNNTL